ncbi:MAG: hypothetical protein M3Y55_08165 [Pseudomonadota bacterium]|nr:hypothetical protein [Pseudomonadota bacterium]MDQ2765228.1 hypothetical protein [Pseudomonadota bacterium]
MEQSPEQVYTDLLRQLASPAGTQPEVFANMFRQVERMHSMGQITDWQLQNAREAYARIPASKMAEAANWALDKAKEGLHAGAELVRDRTRTAVTTYTQQDPVRAILIAAGTGALLMGLVSMLAWSRARKVARKVRG